MGDSDDPGNKCVFNNFGGKAHPYAWCIKNTDQMVDASNLSPDRTGMKMTGEYVAGILKYGNSLICNAEPAIKEECHGLLGNRYVLETQQKCLEVDEQGNVTGNEKNLSKYINNISDGANILTGGAPNPSCNGVIPSTLSAVGLSLIHI